MRKVMVLPCQGSPLERVWLPMSLKGVDLEKLCATPTSSEDLVWTAHRVALRLGLSGYPNLRLLYDSSAEGVTVWICWVPEGSIIPTGLVERSPNDAILSGSSLVSSAVAVLRLKQSS